MMNKSEFKRRVDAIATTWSNVERYYEKESVMGDYLELLEKQYHNMIDDLYEDLQQENMDKV